MNMEKFNQHFSFYNYNILHYSREKLANKLLLLLLFEID